MSLFKIESKDTADKLHVKRCNDFKVTGDGSSEEWKKTDWINISQRSEGKRQSTKMKMLYSDTGLYFLFDNEDEKLTATMNEDFMDLWVEDVVEVFLWTDESSPTYFEYELSPLNHELPLLISNLDGNLTRWMPFHYEADRKTHHETSVRGGEKASNASITAWMAEFYIPYPLLRPLNNIQPGPGTTWRGNFYRVDYDNDHQRWSWQLTGKSFHDYEKFGTIVFE